MNKIANAKQLSRLLRAFNVTPVYNVRGKVNGDWFDSLIGKIRNVAGIQINTNNSRQWLNNQKSLFVNQEV